MRLQALIVTASLAALTAACDRTPSAGEALPLTTAAYEPLRPAPSVEALPAAAPARLAYLDDPREAYGYYDRAYDMGWAFADAPPDYAFDYDGVEPWVWETGDGWYRYVEPLGYGDRYYYYGPDGDYPFLVRDPDYAYGYDRGGRLVVVYDRDGRVMPRDFISGRADVAGRYLARAEALKAASRRARRQSIAEANWAVRQGRLAAERKRQGRLAEERADWRAYRQARAPQQQPQKRWGRERERRLETARLAEAQIHENRDGARVTRLQRRDAPPPVFAQRPDPRAGQRQAHDPAERQARRQQQAELRRSDPRPQQAQAVARQQAAAQARAQRQAESRAEAQARQQAQAAQRGQQAQQQAQARAEVQARQAEARQQRAQRQQAHQAGQAQKQAQMQAQRQQAQAQVQARQQAREQARAAQKAAPKPERRAKADREDRRGKPQ